MVDVHAKPDRDQHRELDREQRRLALACGSRRVTKLIKVTGLGSLLPHFGTLEDARHFVAGGATATS